ncbi:MAG: metallophosphoesterase [Candidatus Aenigmatarchaeota archaeon]
MEILIVSDIHNDVENLMEYIDKVALLNFDVIVFPGDFTDVPPKGFSSLDISKIILEELKSLGKPILALPGNWDRNVIELLEKEGVSLHGHGKVIDDIGFYGFGGARTPFNTSYEPSEEEIENGLKRAFDDVKKSKIKVQVTHAPPIGTKIDVVYSGAHVGSEAVRKAIEAYRPLLAISAHIHEARGIDEINGTKLINSGRFPEGYCGLASIKNGKVEVKIINLI